MPTPSNSSDPKRSDSATPPSSPSISPSVGESKSPSLGLFMSRRSSSPSFADLDLVLPDTTLATEEPTDERDNDSTLAMDGDAAHKDNEDDLYDGDLISTDGDGSCRASTPAPQNTPYTGVVPTLCESIPFLVMGEDNYFLDTDTDIESDLTETSANQP